MKITGIHRHLPGLLFLVSITGCAATPGAPPPPPRAEVRPAPPYTGAAWIGGHYAYRHGKYVWIPGKYVKPPRVGATWVPGHWKKFRRGRRWVPGHWR